MAAVSTSPVLRYIRHLAASWDADLSDGSLLSRFARYRDEAAFAALVRRHGAMVLGVCRRVLRDWHAAEDCFQAAFLVLARKANSLAEQSSLGPWLHAVALRTALKARGQTARRRHQEQKTAMPVAIEYPDDLVWRDLRPLLDDAVDRLPEKYRVPFVLCYLEEKTIAEAAQQLGCPPGTVAARLGRAREKLRGRPIRRGVTLGAGAAGLMFSQGAARAVSVRLAASTAKAAAFAARKAAPAEVISARVVAWSEGVLQAMQTTKIKIVVAGLLLAALLGAGAGVVSCRTQAADKEAAKKEAPVSRSARRKEAPPKPPFRFLSLAEARARALENETPGQPSLLFNGLGLDNLVSPRVRAVPNSKAEGIVVLGIDSEAPRAERERNINQVLLNVETAYWNLYGSYWNLYSREQGLRFAYQAWKIVREKYRKGEVTKADFAQVKGQYDLFRSQRLQAFDTVLDNERQLRAIMGMSIKEDAHAVQTGIDRSFVDATRLVPIDAPTLVEKRPDWDRAWAEALKHRPELRLARGEVQVAEGAKERDRARLVLQDQELKANRFLGLYYRRMSSAYTQIKAARDQREAFATQLRVRMEKYRAGKPDATLDLLLEAQRFWADALATEYQAISTYNNALAGWEYAKGTIRTFTHVTLADKAPADDDKGRAVSYEQKRTETRVRRELGVSADSRMTAPDAGKTAAVSLPALWKSFPPLREAESLPAVDEVLRDEAGQTDVLGIEWKPSDIFLPVRP